MTTLKYWQDRQKEFRDEKVANTKRQIEVSRELQKVSGAYEATSGRDHKIGARQGILNREIDVLSGRMRFIELGLRECETMIRTCTPAETSKSRSRYPLADRKSGSRFALLTVA